MKPVIFTLCSNNYLAHAKSLFESVLSHHSDVHCVIGLVDQRDPRIDYQWFLPIEILDYNRIGYPYFEQMVKSYDVVEFNTAVKPFFFEFLLDRYGAGSQVIYLDPDILIFNRLDTLVSDLSFNDILLTPNLIKLAPEPSIGELGSLRHGMFNLGFLAVRNSNETKTFLKWWQSRLRNHCLIKKGSGLFVDQKWIDLAPLYFAGIHILRSPGYNMAWWNLSERKLLHTNGAYFVNDESTPLYFFHFSGFSPGKSRLTSRLTHHQVLSDDQDILLEKIFKDYGTLLMKNGFPSFKSMKPLLEFRSNSETSLIPKFKKQFKSLLLTSSRKK